VGERFFVARGVPRDPFDDDSAVWAHVSPRHLRVFGQDETARN
jgi:hypothetical protein